MSPRPSEQLDVAMRILNRVLANPAADRRRVYLTGLSMGGYGSWELAMRLPRRFAAVVPVCGGGDERLARRLAHLPIWAWHGAADEAVPIERSRRMVEAIRAAGGNARLTELPGVGHDSWTDAYRGRRNVLAWMFRQRIA